MFNKWKLFYWYHLMRFFLARRFKGFAVPDEPYFDDESTSFFMPLLRECKFYLEYGSGGSTVTAARLHKPFISVDTDKFFLKSVKKKIRRLAPSQRLIHADIGLTGPWGRPLRVQHPSRHRLMKWRDYAGLPWRFINKDFQPDLILVDGRFRVATALTCAANLNIAPHAKIIVDDYVGRPHYHVIEKHLKLMGIHGRMAVFETFDYEQEHESLNESISQYATDWR